MSVQYRISCMAIGGIGAYLVAFEKKKILSFIFRKDFQWAIYILTIGLLVARIGLRPIGKENFPSCNYEWYSVLFCCIIVNLAANPKSVISLDFPWMNYLGKISYGLYMYSPIMRILAMIAVEKLFGREVSGLQMNGCLYLLTILSTIGIAALSCRFFEKKFLSLGKRFVVSKTA
jgi:peptidoglycan/LPS O-acetylase OafA/YrhL